jgi:uncharacterized protein YbbK (DUF523 family)
MLNALSMITIRFLTNCLFTWRVKYFGGNKFEFHEEQSQISNSENVPPSCSEF